MRSSIKLRRSKFEAVRNEIIDNIFAFYKYVLCVPSILCNSLKIYVNNFFCKITEFQIDLSSSVVFWFVWRYLLIYFKFRIYYWIQNFLLFRNIHSPALLPLREVFFFDDAHACKKHLMPSPRVVICSALSNPRFYLEVIKFPFRRSLKRCWK